MYRKQNGERRGCTLFTCLEEQRLAALSFSPYAPKRTAVAGLGVQQPPLFTENMQKASWENAMLP